MEINEAKDIVTALINGINPTTGETLPEISPYNDPQVIRALFAVLSTINIKKKSKKTFEEKQQENIKTGRPKNAGLAWNDELREQLASNFQNGISINELAIFFERTKGAITSELAKQGLIEQEKEVVDEAR
ncbi:hypothetical protein [Pectobacterium aroidearum]|uniref:hypothetical protein n=1 Tax=Pectobacterium aroidearum TaxID=1201031 RepID=UPI0015DDF5D8|nr:hypothetical protein [Pectobacterium aroidearum]MBA0204637.1 hypothetical protein [Pectobacterium aroidearum]UUE56048.1 hypothetical protein L0Y27_12430 [Pectobacterium aroidearum]UUE68708.1 hypothetical protein L0Y21_13100 [Pectobacterium aroidearum]UUE73076.1 hypothetical protein L0Y20_13205 [Pectobacterium aroidearum]UUE77416.1 hypothetical protein L0Y24_12645 [Pectobacterium aroidearum]